MNEPCRASAQQDIREAGLRFIKAKAAHGTRLRRVRSNRGPSDKGTRAPGHQGTRASGHQGIRASGHQGIRASCHLYTTAAADETPSADLGERRTRAKNNAMKPVLDDNKRAPLKHSA